MSSRFYLGYDSTCDQCARVADVAGDELSVLPLASPEMTGWRRQALGESAPWAPTFVQVTGEDVAAWTGSALAVQLSRRLGPMRSFQLLTVIGSVERLGRRPERKISRSSFLGGMAGALGGAPFSSSPLGRQAAARHTSVSSPTTGSEKSRSKTADSLAGMRPGAGWGLREQSSPRPSAGGWSDRHRRFHGRRSSGCRGSFPWPRSARRARSPASLTGCEAGGR